MNKPTDLQHDWPADPANEELARLAERLADAVPGLAPEALERVHQKMTAEFDRAEKRGRRRRLVLGWSIAAAVLLAVAGYAWFRGQHDDEFEVACEPPPQIEDRITVALGDSSSAPTNEKPLVSLDEYRSLFTD
jgi:hypothetical protein